MIPNIDYQRHDLLTRIFIPSFKDKKKFEKKAKEFIKYFKKHEKETLRLIEKFSGFNWTRNKIPVYIIPNGHIYSFTKKNLSKNLPGVVQKFYESNERTTHILIHELCHVNQFQSEFYNKRNKFVWKKDGTKDFVKVEICTDIVAIHVIRELFGKDSKIEKDYWYFMNKLMTSTPAKKLQIPKYLKKWDLNKKTLKKYLIK